MTLLETAAANLLSPAILAFALGLLAGLARSDLSVPEAMGKAMAIYLMFAIGLKGGVAVSESEPGLTMVLAVLLGLALGFGLPLLAFQLLRRQARLDVVSAAAVAAHYGSISVVTFVTAEQFAASQGLAYEGYLVAVMALMETPAIVVGLWLASRFGAEAGVPAKRLGGELLREIFLNGSVVLLVGAFVIGLLVGRSGAEPVAPLFDGLFKGVLCLFLLDMGLLAAARLRGARLLTWRVVAFGLYMPPLAAAIGLAGAAAIGLSQGGALLVAVLAASASYIAVPAAMRLALPKANPGLYVPLSLAVTFPFNVAIGIPLYATLAAWLYGGAA